MGRASYEVGSYEVGSYEMGSYEVGSYKKGSYEVGSYKKADSWHCTVTICSLQPSAREGA